ncbi:MAG: AAA family ATPase, partial [Desulfobacterales bacterium]|nr:AAA family ATPase [Desulfobacterales bacterium]
MRHFHSYGPVDCRLHFCVERRELIEKCTEQLVGIPEEGGHYFTMWGPRQTGKTWLMRQVIRKISEQYADRFALFNFSLGALRGMTFDSSEYSDPHLPESFSDLLSEKLPGEPDIKSWKDFRRIFSKNRGLWDHPLILFIDEVDTLPLSFLDLMVAQFRELYLDRENNRLHGLAMIGVRAVLGIESESGSPFNIQRSMHVPNLTKEEVLDMYHQYEAESGQKILPYVTERGYEVTEGQPSLVSWFGELLAEKYNPGQNKTIDVRSWELVWLNARFSEPNNTVLNLIAKARLPEYREIVMAVFSQDDVPFAFHDQTCSYLYLNGIIEPCDVMEKNGETRKYCRFSSPFVQECIYSALGMEMMKNMPVRPLDPLDDLSDVLDEPDLNLSALMNRYQDYLKRLKAAGHEIWKDQPLRADLR